MRLVDLDPNWVSTSGRQGMGLRFRCPHCDTHLVVWFENPLDNGPSLDPAKHRAPLWKRMGDTFETLTLTPSINASERDPETGKVVTYHWHGFIQNGEMREVS